MIKQHQGLESLDARPLGNSEAADTGLSPGANDSRVKMKGTKFP